MKDVKNIAKSNEILEQLEAIDLPCVISDMEDYACFKMYDNNRIEAERIVGDVFEKTIAGIRKWNKDIAFRQFLFGCVKSLVSQYNNQLGKKNKTYDYEFDIFEFSDDTSIDVSEDISVKELKSLALSKLLEHVPPPDDIEEMIFECWMEGITKSAEIADFYDIDIKEVYKGVKRLERKLGPVREFFTKLSNE